MARPAFVVCLFLASAAGLAAAASSTQSVRDADAMRAKLLQVVIKGQSCPCAARTRTAFSEPEVNAYITHHAKDDLPEGVVSPQVTIVGEGRVSGRAIVDLDKVRTSKQRGWLDPAGYLTGKLPVTAIGILHTRDGIGKFELQSATVGGVEVPKVVLQEMLSYYSRTPDDADGINLDDSFELPASIREIQVGKGIAYVIQ